MTPTEWELLKMLEKDVQRIDASLIEHKNWHAYLEKNQDHYNNQITDLERRAKSLEWLARGDIEELPEEEWWGDKFNKAVALVKRLAAAQDLAALQGLHYEAIELMKQFPKNG